MTFDVATHFGLAADPFAPRDADVVESPALRRALAELLARVDNGARWLAVEGVAGSGRTRLLRLAADALGERGRRVHLATRAREIDPAVLADALLIDEGELIPAGVAGALASRKGTVVLALRPGGGARLKPPVQPVAIAPLTPDEARAFVLAHVERAGGGTGLFAPEALDALAAAGEGSPRRLRRLAGLAMVEAALDDAAAVEERHAAAAVAQSAGAAGVGPSGVGAAAARDPARAIARQPEVGSTPLGGGEGRATDRAGSTTAALTVAPGGASAGTTANRRSQGPMIEDAGDAPPPVARAAGPPPISARKRAFAGAVAVRTLVILVPVGLALAVAGPLLGGGRHDGSPPASRVAPVAPVPVPRAAVQTAPAPPPAAERMPPPDAPQPADDVAPVSPTAAASPPPPAAPASAPPASAKLPPAAAPDRAREPTPAALARAERPSAARTDDVATRRDAPIPARRVSREDDVAETAAINRAQLAVVERATRAIDRPRVFVHYWPYDADAANDVAYALRARGWHVVALRPVTQKVRAPSARFFRAADAPAARRLAADLGDELDKRAAVRDLSRYSRPPAPGTLEVWLPPGTSG